MHLFTGLPWWLSGKESSCCAGAAGKVASIPGSGRSPGGGHGNPFQYSCLENPVDRGAWQLTVMGSHGVEHDWSNLACRHTCRYLVFPVGISGKEPDCQCRRWKRCGFHPWIGKIPWRRAWQPMPIFLPGESQGQRSLEGYGPQCSKELGATEYTCMYLEDLYAHDNLLSFYTYLDTSKTIH